MSRAANCSRRSMLAGAIGVLTIPLYTDAVRATPESMAEAMDEALGKGASIMPGRVKVDLPQLAENGNSVPLKISVDSPMSAPDHVTTIYVFSEKNPVASVVRFHLGPRSGVARPPSRCRARRSQSGRDDRGAVRRAER